MLLRLLFAVVSSSYVYLALVSDPEKRISGRLRSSPLYIGLAFIFGFAIITRVWLYLSAHASYYDESFLAMAVYGWNPARPFQPLDFDQTAPALFVVLSRFIANTWRADELGWRLLPLLASIALLPLFYRAVSSLWSRRAALIGVLFLALNAPLLNYAAIFKQYEVDAFMTTAALAVAGYCRSRRLNDKEWAVLLSGGIVAILLSQAAILVLSALLLFLADQEYQDRRSATPKQCLNLAGRVTRVADDHATWFIGACAIVWIVFAGGCYLILYARARQSDYMQSYWADSFLAFFGDDVAARWINAVKSLFGSSLRCAVIELLLLLTGWYVVARKKDISLLALMTSPVAAAIGLAMLHRYPVEVRVWLFLSPLAILGMSIGAEYVWSLLRKRFSDRVAAGAVSLAVGAVLMIVAGRELDALTRRLLPLHRLISGQTEARMARRAVASILRSSGCDPIYVAARGAPSWFFYSSQLDSYAGKRFARYEQLLRTDSPAFSEASPEQIRSSPIPEDELQLRVGCRIEVYGVASGTPNRYRSRLVFDRKQAMPAWAATEINRIASQASRVFWLYLGESPDFEFDPMLQELRRRRFAARETGLPPLIYVYRVNKLDYAVAKK